MPGAVSGANFSGRPEDLIFGIEAGVIHGEPGDDERIADFDRQIKFSGRHLPAPGIRR
jgi:hypothetical protein